jgi:hypothetical protein
VEPGAQGQRLACGARQRRELAGHVEARHENSKTSRERHRETVPSSLPLAGSQDKLALRALFSPRFHAGPIYAAPPFDPAAGGLSGQALRRRAQGEPALVPCLDLTCALDWNVNQPAR